MGPSRDEQPEGDKSSKSEFRERKRSKKKREKKLGSPWNPSYFKIMQLRPTLALKSRKKTTVGGILLLLIFFLYIPSSWVKISWHTENNCFGPDHLPLKITDSSHLLHYWILFKVKPNTYRHYLDLVVFVCWVGLCWSQIEKSQNCV